MYGKLFEPIINLAKEKASLEARNIIAVDGADASGKTYLAKKLLQEMRLAGIATELVGIDYFHHPKKIRYGQGKDSAQGFYEDSYDYDKFINETLIPFRAGESRILGQSLDLDSDEYCQNYLDIPQRCWLIVEGIFLHRPVLREFWDISVYIEISDALSLERNLLREFYNLKSIKPEEKARFQNRYVEGQKLYRAESFPYDKADFIINNNDLTNPQLIINNFNKKIMNNDVILRPATASDWQSISALLHQMGYSETEIFTQSRLAELLKHPDEYICIAELDGQVAGFMSMHIIPMIAHPTDFARLSYLCVNENLRSAGIGKKLLQKCEEIARERHCNRIELHSNARRTDAHRFYIRENYEDSPKYFVKYIDKEVL